MPARRFVNGHEVMLSDRKKQVLLAALGCLWIAPGALPAQDEAPAPPAKPYKLSVKVPPLRLPDLDGKEVTLFDEETEHVSVLVFWSLRDPVARRYLTTLEALRRDLAKDAVRIYLVNSNHDELVSGRTDPLEKIRKFVRDEKVLLPILIDRKNKVADDFGAVSANHCFVLGSTRRLVYRGGIDDDPRGTLAKQGRDVRPFLRDAIEATLRGETPPETWTRPTGRPIKRWPESAEEGKR